MTRKILTTEKRTIDTIMADILRCLESGGGVSEQELLARYPDLADELRALFAERRRWEAWENEGGALPSGPQH